jgi:hypothetical protein
VAPLLQTKGDGEVGMQVAQRTKRRDYNSAHARACSTGKNARAEELCNCNFSSGFLSAPWFLAARTSRAWSSSHCSRILERTSQPCTAVSCQDGMPTKCHGSSIPMIILCRGKARRSDARIPKRVLC